MPVILPVKKEGAKRTPPAAHGECIDLCTTSDEDSPLPVVAKPLLPEVTTAKAKGRGGKMPAAAAAPSSMLTPLAREGDGSAQKPANDDEDDELMLIGEKSGDLEVRRQTLSFTSSRNVLTLPPVRCS
jgi:hypothetical protein